MVDYVESIKRPFSDLGKLVLGIILSIIPIVNFIFIGWLLDVAKSAMRKDMKLPEFKDLGGLFVNGLLTFIIGFVYMLVVIIIGAIAGVVGGAFSVAGLMSGGAFGIFGAIASLGAVGIVLVILEIVFGLMMIAAVLTYADTKDLGSAFNFGAIAKRAFKGQFILNWILTAVIGGVIGWLIILVLALLSIPGMIIGMMLVSYIVGVFSFTALGQTYAETR